MLLVFLKDERITWLRSFDIGSLFQGPLYLSLLQVPVHQRVHSGSILFCHHLKILNIHKDLVLLFCIVPTSCVAIPLHPCCLVCNEQVYAHAVSDISWLIVGGRTWLLTLSGKVNTYFPLLCTPDCSWYSHTSPTSETWGHRPESGVWPVMSAGFAQTHLITHPSHW